MSRTEAKIIREYGPFEGVDQVAGVTFDGEHAWFASGDKLNALDPKSGKVRVRYVDIESEMYQTLAAYMIRLKPEDLDQPESLSALAKAGNLSETELLARFGPLVGRR